MDQMPKELSWLSFNERVLQEAADRNNPIIERLRFLGIFSSNQDEFFKVRVANLRRAILSADSNTNTENDKILLKKIQDKVMASSQLFDEHFNAVMAELEQKKIFFIDRNDLSDKQKIWLRQHFANKVLRHIVPIWVDQHQTLDRVLQADLSYLVIQLKKADETRHAIIDIPSRLPRFINVPPDRGHARNYFILADEMIRNCLDQIFQPFLDYDDIDAWSMKFARDSEYVLEDDLELSLFEKLSHGMKQRMRAEPVRFSHDREMPADVITLVCEKLGIEDLDSITPGGRYRNFSDLIGFKSPSTGHKRHLEFEKLPALDVPAFQNQRNIFDAIDQDDELLYYPYHKFRYFTEFVRQAAVDPDVTCIKINVYRVANHSQIIESLIDASRNNKNVSVNIELRARFDEEHNLEMSEKLHDEGIHVTFGIAGLKVHSKLCSVNRRVNGEDKLYSVISTGNFNEKTAKVYTDFALFTCHPEICKEVEQVFEFIEHPYKQPQLRHLLVSPINTRSRFCWLIQREIDHVKEGGKGHIRIKLNNLVDSEMVALLYRASQMGVKIDLIIRGMCTLIPGISGKSDNIQIISIVGRFLEHTRMIHFHNNGNDEVYISSADWMTRNLDQRVEVSAPILDRKIRQQLINLFDLLWADNQKARIIDKEQLNHYRPRGNKRKMNSQISTYQYLLNSHQT